MCGLQGQFPHQRHPRGVVFICWVVIARESNPRPVRTRAAQGIRAAPLRACERQRACRRAGWPEWPIPTSKRAQLAKSIRFLYLWLTAKGKAKLTPLASTKRVIGSRRTSLPLFGLSCSFGLIQKPSMQPWNTSKLLDLPLVQKGIVAGVMRGLMCSG